LKRSGAHLQRQPPGNHQKITGGTSHYSSRHFDRVILYGKNHYQHQSTEIRQNEERATSCCTIGTFVPPKAICIISMTAITTLAHVEENVIEDNVFIRLEILPADENRRLRI